MGPTWGPRSFQNREKSIKKGIISCMFFLIDFLIDFGSLLGGFLVDFGCHVEGQVEKKIDTYRKHGKKLFFDSRLRENTKINVLRGSTSNKNQ